MRILLSFLQDKVSKPHPVPSYRFWQHYIKNGIGEAGMSYIEVPEVDWAEGLVYDEGSATLQNWQERSWQATINYIKANQQNIDIFLTYLYPKQINTDAIAQIRKMGIPCVNFYCDNIREFKTVPATFRIFDLIWVPEYEALAMYNKAGVKYINLPMPMWVEPELRQYTSLHEQPGVSFIGSKDMLRENLLGQAIQKGLPLSIRGAGWLGQSTAPAFVPGSVYQKLINQVTFVKQQGFSGLAIKGLQQLNKLPIIPVADNHIFPSPDFDEYINITQRSMVTLGINRVPTFKRTHNKPLTYSRLRDIEAPMLAACYLTEYCEGIGQLYDTDNEINVYRTVDELVQKATELLNNKEKRDKLRINGQQRALHDHAIPSSLKKIKRVIFGR
ncbi:Glycosyl transferases group 1 [Mucilaginibacter gossypiicola]|uniref:Glycosyl transferases group 1 n=1 Tax=Mucilaginibacter gossypiicola TaxID=551995 RepID=A0A1H8N1Q2_9SPHI|nr:glycosyltransferase [Mucilaginibacter gossypiicola]SEO23446.1 Glycosyl transferases group 1 [Mucilaginibacter gossypiicola]